MRIARFVLFAYAAVATMFAAAWGLSLANQNDRLAAAVESVDEREGRISELEGIVRSTTDKMIGETDKVIDAEHEIKKLKAELNATIAKHTSYRRRVEDWQAQYRQWHERMLSQRAAAQVAGKVYRPTCWPVPLDEGVEPEAWSQ